MKQTLVLALLWAFLGGSAVAQEPGRTYRLGVISPSENSLALIRLHTLPELARRGFVEGRNLQVEERPARPTALTLWSTILSRHAPTW
jgi:putative ABC transport system substrate-binding protein